MHLTRSCILGITIAVFAPLLAFAQASCPQITRNLSVGSRGADVIQLQKYLTSQGVLASGNDTGYFGRLTEAALQQWQSSHGVVSSGTLASTGYGAVGPRTRAALAAACSRGMRASPSTGSTGSPQANNSSIQSTIDALLAQVKALHDQISRPTGGQATTTTYYTFTSTASCSWNGGTVASSSSVTAYQSPSVSYGQTCTSQQRVCKKGTLTGSYVNATCVVASAPQTESTATNSEQSNIEPTFNAYTSNLSQSSVTSGTQSASLTQSADTTTSDGNYGQTFTVSWNSTNATNCVVQKSTPGGALINPWALGTSGSMPASPYQVGVHHWRLDCNVPGGTTTYADMYHLVLNSGPNSGPGPIPSSETSVVSGSSGAGAPTVNISADSSQISDVCNITDLPSLKSCFQLIANYNTVNFQNDVTCSDGSCCTDQYGLINVAGVSNKTINGNGHTPTRRTNQRQCSVFIIANATNINVSNIKFDEDESSAGCLPDDNCASTIDVTNSNSVTFESVQLFNGKAYVVYVWGSKGISFLKSAISNAGIINLYIGNSRYAASSDITVSGSLFFSDLSTNALAFEGAVGSNIIDHNIFTRSHFHGLWPTPNTAPSFGAPSDGGIVFLNGSNINFSENIISNGYCDNCWNRPIMYGIEIGDSSRTIATQNLSMMRNTLLDIYGNAFILDEGSIMGPNVSGMNNVIRMVSYIGDYKLNPYLTNNPIRDSSQPQQTTNMIYRMSGQNHHESPINGSPAGSTNEAIFGLSSSPRNGASVKPLLRCFVGGTQDDFVSTDMTCEGHSTVDAVLGFSYEPTYPGALPFFSCLVGNSDHFISWDSGCEGQHFIRQLGYATNPKSPVYQSGSSGAGAPTVNISADSSQTAVGQSFNVSWSSSNATSCNILKSTPNQTTNLAWCVAGQNNCGTSGTQSVAPIVVGTHTYTITCTGPGGSKSALLSHVVN